MRNKKFTLRGDILALLFALCLGATATLHAQQPDQSTPPATPPQPQTPAQAGSDPAAKPAADPTTTPTKSVPSSPPLNNDRLFFALPNVLTVENASFLPPMTARQKFKAEATSVFDPIEVVFVGAQAGIGQADNDEPTYGQGFKGYAKRFGTAYADTIIASFNTAAIWPSILHQDPRYYQLGKGSAFHRIGYSALRVVITRNDRSGQRQFNYSEFIGNGIASLASNAYHPGPHTIIGTTNVMATQMLVDIIANELKEFWPDMRRAITHKP